MVGVPGRSKGCHTCRKRKKKCDLQRPICGNCTRGKFVCAGYEKGMIMIHVDGKGKGSYQPPVPQQESSLQRARTASRSPSLADFRSRDLNRSAFEIECLNAYRNLYAPHVTVQGQVSGVQNIPAYLTDWWSHVLQTVPQNDLVRSSFLALSASQVAHVTENPALHIRGVELYCESLGLLRRALDPAKLEKRGQMTFDLEMAAFALATYEFFRQEKPSIDDRESAAARFRKCYDRDEIRISARYRGHIGGMVKLMRLHDPEEFAHQPRHQLFVQLRHIWIPFCIEDGEATFLGLKEWLTKPWEYRTKTYYDTAWDLLAPIPALLEDWITLSSSPLDDGVDDRAQELRKKCWEMKLELDNWYHYTAFAEPYLRPNEAQELRGYVRTMEPEDLPPLLFQYGIWHIYAWTLYWAASITLYCTTPLVYQRFPPPDFPNECALAQPGIIGTYCLCIARSTTYFLQSALSGLLSETAIRVPVALVQKVLSHPALRATGDPKLNEAESILQDIGKAEVDMLIRESTESPSTSSSSEEGLELVQRSMNTVINRLSPFSLE